MWIFMLVCCLLIPTVMVVFGLIFKRKAPKDINVVFGYRTERSMKNEDTWQFAHRHIGRTWLFVGIPMLILSLVAMVLCVETGEIVVTAVGAGLSMAQLVVLIVSIFPTERALDKTFDKNGNRR